MRILIDEEDVQWDTAWTIVTNTFFYTNHTVLPVSLLLPLSPSLSLPLSLSLSLSLSPPSLSTLCECKNGILTKFDFGVVFRKL